MCGLTGFCDFTQKSDLSVLVKMTQSIKHRGPNHTDFFFQSFENNTIGLGFNRLSILDTSELGNQPQKFKHLVMVFNGAIYNFKEIRKKLENEGYTFDSQSDTEVVIKSFHFWGDNAVDLFIGMFAIVLYNSHTQTIKLIRDRAGVKPLYWYFDQNTFLFGSELKTFHFNPNFIKQINNQALQLYFNFGYIPQPYTIFNSAYKLKAGHIVTFDIESKNFEEKEYWNVFNAYSTSKLNISFEESKTQLKEIFKSAFRYRMISDVPVGMFLSGGYDSTAVTAILTQELGYKIKTYTVGFHSKKYNEAEYAEKIAKHLNTHQKTVYTSPNDALKLLPDLVSIWDEPFADSSMIPTLLVSELAKKEVTVSLSSDGGDELFGGYEKYVTAQKIQKWQQKIPFKKIIYKILSKYNPTKIPILNRTYNFERRYYLLLEVLKANNLSDFMKILSFTFNSFEINQILTTNTTQIKTNFDSNPSEHKVSNEIDKMMAIDYVTYQLDDILTKVDRATMHHALEGREPLLDHRILEFVASLPIDYKISGGNQKILLKSIVHDYVPTELMERPKQGFAIPKEEWLSNDLFEFVEKYINKSKLEKTALINVEGALKIKDKWLKNKKINVDKIWTLLVFLMWYEKWME